MHGKSQTRNYLFMAFALAVGAVLLWQWWRVLSQPPRFVPTSIQLVVIKGRGSILGRNELAAVQAEASHIRVRRDDEGAWYLSNVSQSRAVEVRHGGRDERVRHLTLASSQRIAIAGHLMTVNAYSPDWLELRESNNTWDFDGTRLRRNGEWMPYCKGRGLKAAWNAVVPGFLQMPTTLELGGLVACATRIPLSGVARGSARIIRENGAFVLRAGSAGGAARAICVDPNEKGACVAGKSLHAQERPLSGMERMIVGRTFYGLRIKGDTLFLTPRIRVRQFEEKEPVVKPDVRWTMAEVDVWRWPFASPWLCAAIAGLIVPLGASALLWRRCVENERQAIALSFSLCMMAAAVVVYKSPVSLGVSWALSLVTLSSVLAMAISPQHGMARFTLRLFVLLLLAGLATQLSLGLAANDTSGLRHFQANAAIASFGLAGLFACGLLARQDNGVHLNLRLLEVCLMALALAALAMLLLQVLGGNETGVWGVQPVELAKLALILLSAHVLALLMDWAGEFSLKLWARFLVPILVFCALVLVSLFLVRDFSPLLLLTAWLFGMVFAWSLATRRKSWFVLAMCALLVCVSAVWLVHETGLEWFRSSDFYSDRMQVWINAAQHPYSGFQFRKGVLLAQEGGLFGTSNAHPWMVPEVQNDFAPAYFLSRFGALGGAAMLVLQMVYIGCLLMLGWRAQQANCSGDYQIQTWGRVRFFILFGGAAILFAHFVIAWSTSLGLLPVMGQPMPWMSSAGSMLAFFIFPLQLFYVCNSIHEEA